MPEFPKDTIVPVPVPFKDARGIIQNVLREHHGSVVIIRSEPNAWRASHFHREDFHYCYVVEGCLDYYERPVGSAEKPRKIQLHAGKLWFTGPNIEHWMHFLELTTFLTLGGLPRTSESYESDLVRLAPLPPEWW